MQKKESGSNGQANEAGIDELWQLKQVIRERSIGQADRLQSAHVKAVMREHYGENFEMGQEVPINLNSPTITNNHAAEKGLPWWVKAAAGAGLLASGAGAAAGVPWLLKAWQDRPAATVPATEKPPTYFLKLGN